MQSLGNLILIKNKVNPKLSEEEKDMKLAELSEKDPEIERLKGIAEEKSPYPKEPGEEEEGLNWITREVYLIIYY